MRLLFLLGSFLFHSMVSLVFVSFFFFFCLARFCSINAFPLFSISPRPLTKLYLTLFVCTVYTFSFMPRHPSLVPFSRRRLQHRDFTVFPPSKQMKLFMERPILPVTFLRARRLRVSRLAPSRLRSCVYNETTAPSLNTIRLHKPY